MAQLLTPHVHDDEPRPALEAHGDYIFGVFLVAVVIPDKDEIYYQEVDFVATREMIVTVRKTPPGGEPYDTGPVREVCRRLDDPEPGLVVYHLLDDVAERYLDLIDELNDEIDELEDHVEDWPAEAVRQRLSKLRHDILHIRRTLAPTRDAVRSVIENRVDLEGNELFSHDVEISFGSAQDKLLRASEGLELSRDLVAGVRDYQQSKIANDQNDAMKRLTAIASVLLLPTFIVGLYGQNFKHIPELSWAFGYWWSWGWIIASTIGQLVFFRRKGWL
ncbi:MAG: magnesium transporter [Gaiellaceae bacterium]|nr:magnesium transporter [Gaiellaceae bacterium]